MTAILLLLFWSTIPAQGAPAQNAPAQGAEVHGSVHDTQSGEALARVTVKLAETGVRVETDASGNFDISGIAPGNYRLLVSSVGYRLLEKRIELKANDLVSFELALSPEASRHKDTVEVHADPFDLALGSGPTAFTLSGSEAKNLASVLADDPMRALQSVPGVAGNDDFDSRFSLHGAPYDRLGLYLDGILLHQPFHTVQGTGPSGSTAVFNGDMVGSMSVESEGYGAQFENRTAGVIQIQTREGSTDRIHMRVNASLPDAGVLAEGPFGKHHKGSWLVSARKSYLQYFLKNLAQDMPSMAFGFMDTQTQLNYSLTANQSFSLKLIDGSSNLDRSAAKSMLGLNAAETARYHYTTAHFGWQFTPSHSFLVNTRAAFTRERYDNDNILGQRLGNGYYGEWVAKSDATWAWSDTAQLQFGGVARPAHGSGIANYYFNPTSSVATNQYAGNAAYAGGYAQQSFTQLAKGLSASFGGRWDTSTAKHQSALSPQASIAYSPWARGRLSFGWGRYAQFAEISSLYAANGNTRLLPATAEHYTAAFEQRIGLQTRVRVEAFQRNDRNLLFQPLMEARLIGGGGVSPDVYRSPILNSLSGRTKGAEVFIQRRTANGWTGWASYTFSRSEMQDALTGIRFLADQDQRHTINTYVSYRLRPSVNVSAKFAWGSGFPVPGFFSQRGDRYYLAADRNLVRLPAYQRLDIRVNKSKTLKRGKMTVFVEVSNVLNHSNYRFDSYNGFSGATRQAYISLSQMFPILPSAGVTFDF
ncbi:MAG TPA: TonB-dependent receptor [Bryobacteraceae bacterium]|nr:TonB-dependent receptor [Bryobacteraceae bacterium]